MSRTKTYIYTCMTLGKSWRSHVTTVTGGSHPRGEMLEAPKDKRRERNREPIPFTGEILSTKAIDRVRLRIHSVKPGQSVQLGHQTPGMAN